MTSKEEISCIFDVTTSATVQWRINDVFGVKFVIKRTTAGPKPCVQNLQVPATCVEIFRNIYPALI